MTEATPAQRVEVFEGIAGRRTLAVLSLAGAGALVVFALVGFWLALYSRAGQFQLHTMTTVPTLFAVCLFTAGLKTLRGPRQVRLTESQLEVVYSDTKVRAWRWEEISFVKVESGAITAQRRLGLYGADGKALIRLTHDFERFDEMEKSITKRLVEHPAPGRDEAWRKKNRRVALFMLFAGLALSALGGLALWMGLNDLEAARLLKERGEPATAKVVEKLIAPDGRTHRIHYEVVDANGKRAEENVEIPPSMWQMLNVGDPVAVMAVPGRPDISRMLEGQIDDPATTSPSASIWMGVGILVLGLLAFGLGILGLRGKDLTGGGKKKPQPEGRG